MPPRNRAERTERTAAQATREKGRSDGIVTVGIALLLLLGALWLRMGSISQPAEVVFDEVHFGSHAGMYVNRTFFFDVHPPLGKLLFAAVGYLNGYDGKFKFASIGLPYPPEVPYVAMRSVAALAGAFMVPLAYLTVRGFGLSYASSFLAGLLILFDNALETQSHYILLDSPMVCFMMAAACCWSQFLRQRSQAFSKLWWALLAGTGIFLACAMSVKVVGIFVIAVIGLSTARDLWELIADPKNTYFVMLKHLLARVACLIVLPLFIYFFFFYIHLVVLKYPGPGSPMMSTRFRHSLDVAAGKQVDMFADVTQASLVVLRNEGSGETFLHSHEDDYPNSDRNQVTMYSHMDDNNWWRVIPSSRAKDYQAQDFITGARFIADKQIIRLQHAPTTNFLTIFKETKAHVTPNFLEVSSVPQFPSNSSYDGSDLWRVEFVKQSALDRRERLQALTTTFRLIHIPHNCVLYTKRGVNLPKSWGFNQQEVTCISQKLPAANSYYTHFTVDRHINPDAPASAPRAEAQSMSFYEKMWEVHDTMIKGNELLEADHPFKSTPGQWPSASKGILYWSKNTDKGWRNIYLVGNLYLWRLALLATPIFLLSLIVLSFLRNREAIFYTSQLVSIERAGLFFFGMWFVNWIGFFMFERQLFLHHYLPALVFNIMLISVVFELVTLAVPIIILRQFGRNRVTSQAEAEAAQDASVNHSVLRWLAVVLVAFVIGAAYFSLRPLSLGTVMTPEYCRSIKLLSTWEFNC